MYKMVVFTSTFLKQQSAQECIIDASAREGKNMVYKLMEPSNLQVLKHAGIMGSCI
jgi:hypothetical protein